MVAAGLWLTLVLRERLRDGERGVRWREMGEEVGKRWGYHKEKKSGEVEVGR